MRRPGPLWAFARDRLGCGEPVMLLNVVDCGPGSPGRTGFAAVVAADGTMVGTIGGGPMEQRLVQDCVARLRSDAAAPGLRTLRHLADPGPRATASGLHCGGWQQVCMHRLEPRDLDLALRICTAVAQRRSLDLALTPDGIEVADRAAGPAAGGSWHFRTGVRPDPVALIVGGGQVGRALQEVLATLDLDVVATGPPPGAGIAADLLGDPAAAFAVVVCPTIEQDAAALAALLPLRLRYLGLLGTAAKRQAVLQIMSPALRGAFHAQHVRSPAGLPIGSHTPEEIAVSIAAEIIAVRNRRPPAPG